MGNDLSAQKVYQGFTNDQNLTNLIPSRVKFQKFNTPANVQNKFVTEADDRDSEEDDAAVVYQMNV